MRSRWYRNRRQRRGLSQNQLGLKSVADTTNFQKPRTVTRAQGKNKNWRPSVSDAATRCRYSPNRIQTKRPLIHTNVENDAGIVGLLKVKSRMNTSIRASRRLAGRRCPMVDRIKDGWMLPHPKRIFNRSRNPGFYRYCRNRILRTEDRCKDRWFCRRRQTGARPDVVGKSNAKCWLSIHVHKTLQQLGD